MGEDGACLFRAVADQVYGDQEMHGLVRQNCIDYMVSRHLDQILRFLLEMTNQSIEYFVMHPTYN